MDRETIDFGIDLGTTTSAIAVAAAHDATVVRNNLAAEFTPSAVYVNRSKKIYVGARAKERVEADPGNACAEFKLQMGVRGEHKRFEASGVSMNPEELSAEVLKSLRADVAQSLNGENINAAVITVPAAFELDQCDATRRAAVLAGLDFAPLIQEPSAAAWAYSVHGAPRRGFWLVYDFGGGTFDAAVIRVADGEFGTINHAGNNLLGGKLIDWAIVEELFIPAARELGLAQLSRGDARSTGNIAKLKAAAESAKIQLSRMSSTEVEVELKDGSDTDVLFNYELTRADLERFSMPLYRQSIELCRKALAEASLGPADVERILLVGGTTIAPGLRELLADPTEGLGIQLDYSLDPVTVVARGAAIFAGTQRKPRNANADIVALEQGRVVVNLKHAPAGPETEPLVGGSLVTTPPRDWTGGSIEFVNRAVVPEWCSGRIPLTPEGTFTGRLLAEEGTTSTYAIELYDAKANVLETDPDRMSYRQGMGGTAPVLSHSVGVGLANNEVVVLLPKGTELPAKKRLVMRTILDVRRDQSTGLIRVPIVEGELARADRNTPVGTLEIRPAQVRRDVPAGSEVEVCVEIDTSFTPRADAFVPLLDEEFPIDIELGRAEALNVADLRSATEELTQQFTRLTERADQISYDAAKVDTLIEAFRHGPLLAEVRRLSGAAEHDRDAPATWQKALREAQSALDAIESALEFPELVDEGRALTESVRHLVDDAGSQTQRGALRDTEQAMEAAISDGNRMLLQRQINRITSIGRDVLRDTGRLDAVTFSALEEQLSGSANMQVQRLLQDGRSAIARGDIARLQGINDKLRPFAQTVVGSDTSGLSSTVMMRGDR